MMDRQCSSCGGFCKKSGCERENVPDIRVQEAALVGENMILKSRVTELEACIKSHGIAVKTFAGGEAHYCIGEKE